METSFENNLEFFGRPSPKTRGSSSWGLKINEHTLIVIIVFLGSYPKSRQQQAQLCL